MSKQKAILFLLFSTVIFCFDLRSAKACAIPSQRSILLDLEPTKLHGATFMGKVKITRATTLRYMTLIRGIIEKSKTHPHLVDNKVTLIHKGTFSDYLCPIQLGNGHEGYYKGYVIGRVMNLNTDTLVVDPYVGDNILGSIDEASIDVGKEELPLKYFYEP